MSETKTNSGGIGFVGLLQAAFIVLKLCGVINWPWLYVFAPFIISTALFFVFFAVALVVAAAIGGAGR